jgi:hypothetical protein
MPRYKKASDGQWPGYPFLQLNDISTLSIRQNQFIAKALVNNRKGRVVLLMDKEIYDRFLETVRERKGDISAQSVNEAAQEAIRDWVKKD